MPHHSFPAACSTVTIAIATAIAASRVSYLIGITSILIGYETTLTGLSYQKGLSDSR